jgi:hypothetical protein
LLKAYALTVDLHDGDEPSEIERCSDWLAAERAPATFFIPTTMLAIPRLRRALQHLAASGHELGTHGHFHRGEEALALQTGSRAAVSMLERSHGCFSDFFVRAPLYFRSPGWCGLGERSVEALNDLGYLVDASSTPQRPGILSSLPGHNPWLFSRRRVHPLQGSLLEIPTSSLLVPLGSPTFQTLRTPGSLVLTRLLMLEATLRHDVVVVAQFHVGDFFGDGESLRSPGSLTLRAFLPRTPGGIPAKLWLRELRRDRIAATTAAVHRTLRRFRPCSLRSIYERLILHVGV